MNNKDIILIVTLFILFAILIFTTPYIGSITALNIWMLFFAILLSTIIIRIMISLRKKSKNELIEKFKNQHIVIQVLEIAFILLLICQVITMQYLKISTYLFGLIVIAIFIQWFFKKEE